MSPDTRTLILAGPTASGKTALALALAEHLPLEIISVDSALIYRGMDIGTAKPTASEQAAVPHHLIDILDPLESYSAARFVADARRLMDEIRGRGRTPLLVGGTMLYFKALFDGLDDMPTAHPDLRAHIAAEAAALGWPALHAQLAEVDPPTAARLQPQDAQRIARALEVWRASGRPLSSFQTGSARQAPALAAELLSLEPDDRAWLHQRIALRFEQMLQQGLVEEVWALMRRSDLHPDLPAMRCVGYRQAWTVLEAAAGSSTRGNNAPVLSPTQMQDLMDTGVAATRQLAKRQLTWLRSMPQRHRIAADHPQALAQTLAQVQALWGAP